MAALTIVVPCYNAADFLSETLAELDSYLSEHPEDRVVLVDDGSDDRSLEVAEITFAVLDHPDRFRLVRHPHNRGKGCAVRTGMAEVETELVCFTDVDLAYDLANLDPMRYLAVDNALVIANRVHPQSVYCLRPRQFSYFATRHQSSRLMNAIMSRLLRLSVADIQAGLKLGRSDCFLELAQATSRAHFAFDLELLAIARARNVRLIEAPVHYRSQDAGSTVRFLSSTSRFFWDALQVTWRQLTGGYR